MLAIRTALVELVHGRAARRANAAHDDQAARLAALLDRYNLTDPPTPAAIHTEVIRPNHLDHRGELAGALYLITGPTWSGIAQRRLVEPHGLDVWAADGTRLPLAVTPYGAAAALAEHHGADFTALDICDTERIPRQ